ncbi:MAG: SpoIVB peptidase S55 domain-containing protein [Schwartzia sp. (in: firmicutes)]
MYRSMKRIGKRIIAALAASWALSFGSPAFAAPPEILPLSEVTAGMQGTLYTVVDPSGDIVSFDAEILGVYRTDGSSLPYIIARSEGAFADTDGGLMQGMSGSPVYVDGLLIGAASATLSNMNPHTFLITPIEEMLPLWDMPDKKNRRPTPAIDVKKATEEREKREEKANEKARNRLKKGIKSMDDLAAFLSTYEGAKDDPAKEIHLFDARPEKPEEGAEKKASRAGFDLKSTVFVSGFDKEAQILLQKKLDPMGIRVMTTGFGSGGSYSTNYDAVLLPGAAVGAALAYGDFAMTAIGTVTAVDDHRILAFGHEFLHRGNVNYFMTDAQILAMVNGVSDGQKLGVGTQIIGRFSQDREAGIAGTVGSFPMVVPLRVKVTDTTLKRDRLYASSIAYDEDFLPTFAAVASYSALGRTMDHKSQGTVKVRFEIRTNAVTDGRIERTNMYYAANDVGQIAFGELAQAMNLICTDKERETDVYDVKVDVEAETARRTASLLTAVPDKKEVKPGDTVTFKVTLKPYRAETVTVEVPFTVPESQPEGTMHLEVHGGGLALIEKLLEALQEANDAPPPVTDEERALTTENRLRSLVETPANNDIVVEPGGGPVPTEEEQEKAIREAIRRQEEREAAAAEAKEKGEALMPPVQPPKPPRTVFPTDYVIDNHISTSLEISKKAE